MFQLRARAGFLEPVVGVSYVHGAASRHATLVESGRRYFDDRRLFFVPSFRGFVITRPSGHVTGEQTRTFCVPVWCGCPPRVLEPWPSPFTQRSPQQCWQCCDSNTAVRPQYASPAGQPLAPCPSAQRRNSGAGPAASSARRRSSRRAFERINSGMTNRRVAHLNICMPHRGEARNRSPQTGASAAVAAAPRTR
jgi:hypothetical protein